MSVDRQVLFGVGVGLMLAAALVAVGGGRRPTSEVEIIRRAKALGMTFPGERRLALEAVEPKPTEEKAPAAAAPAPQPSPPAPRPSSPAPQGPSQVTVVVPPGATAGEVARLLRAKSLIADEGEFLRIAVARQAEARFLPGTYRLPSDIAVKDLIASLLSGPQAR